MDDVDTAGARLVDWITEWVPITMVLGAGCPVLIGMNPMLTRARARHAPRPANILHTAVAVCIY